MHAACLLLFLLKSHIMFSEIETQQQYNTVSLYIILLDMHFFYMSHLQSHVLFSKHFSFSPSLHWLRLCHPGLCGALLPTGCGYLPQSLPLRLGGATATHALCSIAPASWVGATGWDRKFGHFLSSWERYFKLNNMTLEWDSSF